MVKDLYTSIEVFLLKRTISSNMLTVMELVPSTHIYFHTNFISGQI